MIHATDNATHKYSLFFNKFGQTEKKYTPVLMTPTMAKDIVARFNPSTTGPIYVLQDCILLHEIVEWFPTREIIYASFTTDERDPVASLMAKVYNIKTMRFNSWNEFIMSNINFNNVIGNPPYNKGMFSDSKKSLDANNIGYYNGYAHCILTDKLVPNLEDGGTLTFIMPAGIMGLKSCRGFREKLMNSYSVDRIKIYNNASNNKLEEDYVVDKAKNKYKYFPLGAYSSIIAITISNREYQGITEIIREDLDYVTSAGTIVDLRDYDAYWPLVFDDVSKNILNKIISKGIMSPRDKLTDAYTYLSSANIITGSKNDWEKKKKELADIMFEEGRNHVSLKNLTDGLSKNYTKLWTFNRQDIKENDDMVVIDLGDDEDAAELYFEFTKTKLFNLFFSMIKTTPKTQPYYFEDYIGWFNFTDNDFNTFFGFTQEEIDYIENLYT